MDRRILKVLALVVLFSLTLSGCYYWSARKEMKEAAMLVEQLKAADGPNKVPYEYTSAEKFLEISRLEYDSSDYKGAHKFATVSKAKTQEGLSQVKK